MRKLAPELLAGRRIVALASFDSFIKTAGIMLSACADAGADTELVIVEIKGRCPAPDQLLRAGVDPDCKHVPMHTISSNAELLDADAIILLMDGRRTKEALLRLEQQFRSRLHNPIIVSAYPGLVFREHLNGFMDRGPVDLLCLNSEQDLELYFAGCERLGGDPSNAIACGLPLLWNLTPRSPVEGGDIVFFEQPSVPNRLLQREFVADALACLARRLPDRRIVLKARTRSTEATLHRNRLLLEDLLRGSARKIENLTVSHAPIEEILARTGVALTISSTAALEAIALEVPTRIITDFGVNETLGNSFFVDSGLFEEFDGITGNESIPPDVDIWLSSSVRPPAGKSVFLSALATRLAQSNSGPSTGTRRPLFPYLGSEQWLTYAGQRAGLRGISSGEHSKTASLAFARRIRDQWRSLLRRRRSKAGKASKQPTKVIT